jgi:transcription antitermination factor NusG
MGGLLKLKFKNGDKVKITKGTFAGFVGECYMDGESTEIYIPENAEHTSFNVVVTYDMIEKIS